MSLYFNASYAESIMDKVDKSIIHLRETHERDFAGFKIELGSLEFQTLKVWHNSHRGNFVITNIDGEYFLFGYPVTFIKEYESLIQVKGRYA